MIRRWLARRRQSKFMAMQRERIRQGEPWENHCQIVRLPKISGSETVMIENPLRPSDVSE